MIHISIPHTLAVHGAPFNADLTFFRNTPNCDARIIDLTEGLIEIKYRTFSNNAFSPIGCLPINSTIN
jgi:hypothetical protein